MRYLTIRCFTRHTKPGGWCEFKDFDLTVRTGDDSLPEDSHILKYHNLVFEALGKIGRDHMPGPKLKKWVEEAGFFDIKEEVLPVPIGMWPRDAKLVRWKGIYASIASPIE